MKKVIKVFVLALFLVLPLSALALTGYNEDTVVLEVDEVIDGNYYAAGNSIEIYGTVNGDLFLAGNSVSIESENINGDIFVVSSNSIMVKGKTNGSLRMVGQYLTIMGEVRDNVLAFGQSLKVDADSKIGGHLSFFGRVVNVAGEVGGRLEGAIETLRLSGTVNKDVDVYLSNGGMEKIKLADQATIGGTLYYQALKEVEINSNATMAGISYNEIIKKAKPAFNKGKALGLLAQFFSLLIIGMIGLHLWPKFFTDSYQQTYRKPVVTFFKGLLLLVVTPLACILLAITVIGLPLALILMVIWALLLYLAKVMSAWLIGRFVKDKFFPKVKWHRLSTFAVGIALFLLICKIPIVGFFICMIVYLLAWGIFVELFKRENK
ncbi:hypothetical protein K8R42_02070 [bacterium]|nr:hypothetical protein [bacterium]